MSMSVENLVTRSKSSFNWWKVGAKSFRCDVNVACFTFTSTETPYLTSYCKSPFTFALNDLLPNLYTFAGDPPSKKNNN